MRLTSHLQILGSMLLAGAACSDSKEFVGSSPKLIAKAEKVSSKIVGALDSYLQSTAACSLEAERETPDSTTCKVSISVTSGLEKLTPELSVASTLEPWTMSDGVFNSRVSCPASGVSIDAVFKEKAPSSDSQNEGAGERMIAIASCGVDVQPIEQPVCRLSVDTKSIQLGGKIQATIVSADDKIPASSFKINGISATAGQPLTFTPAAIGEFTVTGTVFNSSGSANCIEKVVVNSSTTSPAVIPPSCAISATRENPLATSCDVTVSSTGGPISGQPTLAGVTLQPKLGSAWGGKVNCSASGATLTASVKNVQGAISSCDTRVDAIPLPKCSITAIRETSVSTRCSVSVSSIGGPISGAPQVSGINSLTQKATSWEANVNCDAPEKIFEATVSNPSGSEKCSSTVAAIVKPACTISTDIQTINLGESFFAILKPVTNSGDILSAKINGSAVDPNQAVKLTPTLSGNYLVSASVQNPASTESCSTVVKVNPAVTQQAQVIPPSCTMTATRSVDTPTQCKVLVSSTGGAISGVPTVAGASTLVQNGTSWETTVTCSPSAQNYAATVVNAEGTKANCSAQVASIPIWVQTDRGSCDSVCKGVNRVSAKSPKYGNACVSGEVRGDAVGIKYNYGTWGYGVEFYNSVSVGERCYGSNSGKSQKRDNDKTDYTVGCYCK